MLKTTMGMLGEYEYDTVYNDNDVPPVTWALYLSFLVINCLIIMNLLVSHLMIVLVRASHGTLIIFLLACVILARKYSVFFSVKIIAAIFDFHSSGRLGREEIFSKGVSDKEEEGRGCGKWGNINHIAFSLLFHNSK